MSIDASRATIGSVRLEAAEKLKKAGIETASLDARILLAHAFGIGADALLLRESDAVSPEALGLIEAFVSRRIAGEPVARIIGHREFWSLDLALTPDTLVPRPDTETLVAAAVAKLRQRDSGPLRLLDVGTGSGAILLALLSELPNAFGIGTDIAFGAASAAHRNAERLGLESRASFLVCNWADAVGGRFDGIVSNPPYIRGGDIHDLPVEVRNHDPVRALDGGRDGFDGHRAVLAAADRLLARDGMVFIEVGHDQGSELAALAERDGWKSSGHADLVGITRVIELSRV